MITKTLHFRVHPNIIEIPRHLFWYENKQRVALDFMDDLSSGKLTIKQTKKLLDGDAYFITKDDGKTLTLVNEVDKEWKKELQSYLAFKKREKEKR